MFSDPAKTPFSPAPSISSDFIKKEREAQDPSNSPRSVPATSDVFCPGWNRLTA
ncbi:hypothetical protein ACTXT7_009497 [Hymenolepis weldensis]